MLLNIACHSFFLYIIVSKILLKFDNNEYRSVIIIGITFIIDHFKISV